MKKNFVDQNLQRRLRACNPLSGDQAGFALAQALVASAIFTMVMGSIMIFHVFFVRVSSGVSRQLELNSQARVVNIILNEIKQAQSVVIQNYDGSSFSTIPSGSLQQGNALIMTVPNGTNTLQVFYWLNSTGQLYRATVSVARSKLWLNNITNSVPFAMKDYGGGVLSNLSSRTLVDVSLFALDSNVRNFRQTLALRSAAEKRN
jgi:type II secretory pathway component PulJ